MPMGSAGLEGRGGCKDLIRECRGLASGNTKVKQTSETVLVTANIR